MTPSQRRTATLRIRGMTCSGCELLLERKLKAIPGITNVDANFRTGLLTITADGANVPSEKRITEIIRKAGYELEEDNVTGAIPSPSDSRKWLEIGASLIVIFALWKLLQAFDLVSLAPSTSGALTFGGIFVIGLVAGTSSCLAVTGGLLLALAAKHNELHQGESPWGKFKLLLHFNVGRLLSYFLLGGVIGFLGQSIALGARVTGYLNIAIAVVMFVLALSILQIIPKGAFPFRPPKALSHWIAGLSESEHPAASFALGAMTFFLPCGFTQSLQLVALASGSFLAGGLTMFIFALGTLPALIGISAVSSTATGNTSRLFLRFAGTFVFVLALFNFTSGLALTGVSLGSLGGGVSTAGAAPEVRDGVQEISMRVTRYGYEPDNLTIKSGIPVRWNIDGTGAQGCTSGLVIPALKIEKSLRAGSNIIEFTAPKPGEIAFSCSMGMVWGTLHVI